jgi:uncharacterized protein
MATAQDIIKTLKLEPHPEGGWYTETFRDSTTFTANTGNRRPHSTCIYYLLESHDRSHWHKVDAVEVWHWYAGAPLKLSLWREDNDGEGVRDVLLGGDILNGERPQGFVEKWEWQSAVSLGDWTLVGCTVAPGFEYDGFVMAEKGWSPGANSRPSAVQGPTKTEKGHE